MPLGDEPLDFVQDRDLETAADEEMFPVNDAGVGFQDASFVSLFDRDNKPIIHLGDDPAWTAEVKKMQIRNDPTQWVPGKFVHPHDACFDRHGNIFVVEWVQTGRVTLLRRLG